MNTHLIRSPDDVRAYRYRYFRQHGYHPVELRVSQEQFQSISDGIAPGQRIDELEIQGVRVCV